MLTIEDIEPELRRQGVNLRSFRSTSLRYHRIFAASGLDPEDVLPLMICDVMEGHAFTRSPMRILRSKDRTAAPLLEEDLEAREGPERGPCALEALRGVLGRFDPRDRSWALRRACESLGGTVGRRQEFTLLRELGLATS